MLSLLKLGLSEYAEKHVFGSLNLNNSELFRLSFEDNFLGTLDTYTKKINPPSTVLGGGCTYGLLAHSLLSSESLLSSRCINDRSPSIMAMTMTMK